jgi:hypothetical protein
MTAECAGSEASMGGGMAPAGDKGWDSGDLGAGGTHRLRGVLRKGGPGRPGARGLVEGGRPTRASKVRTGKPSHPRAPPHPARSRLNLCHICT